MSTISLPKLPSFAQEIIVSSLDPAQVLGITLRSKLLHRIVSRSKYSMIPVRWLIQQFASVEIITAEESLDYICHGPDFFWKVKDIECYKFRNGFNLKYGAQQDKLIIEHLLSILNISQFEVAVETGKIEELTIFEHVKKFTQVYLKGVLLTASQVKYLLEYIETDSLTIRNMPNVIEYARDFVFNHRKIIIHGFPNIPFSSILSMKTEYLITRLNVTDSTVQDIVGFVRHWASGGLKHFRRLSIQYGLRVIQIMSSLLRGIDEMENITIQETTREGRKFTRTDGKRASFEFCGSCLVFSIGF